MTGSLGCIKNGPRIKTIPNPELRVINEDFLKFDLSAWVEENLAQKIAVVGNIPYNISSPIVIKCLEFISKLERIEFLTQLEFAEELLRQ